MRALFVASVFAVVGCNKSGGFLWWGVEDGITDSELEAAMVLTDDCGSNFWNGDVSNCDRDSEGEYVNCKTDATAFAFLENYTAIQGDVVLVSVDEYLDGTFDGFQNIRCIDGDLNILTNTKLVYGGDGNAQGQTSEDFLSLTKITGNLTAEGCALPFTNLRTIGGGMALDNTMPTANMDGEPNYGMGSLELIGGDLLIQSIADICYVLEDCPYDEMIGMENLLYIGGGIGFHNNAIPQCEIDAFANRMRELGWKGTAVSSNNNSPRTCN